MAHRTRSNVVNIFEVSLFRELKNLSNLFKSYWYILSDWMGGKYHYYRLNITTG